MGRRWLFFLCLYLGSSRSSFSATIHAFEDILHPKIYKYVVADQYNNTPGATKELDGLNDDEKDVTWLQAINFTPVILRYFNLSEREARIRLCKTKLLSHDTWFVFDIKTGKNIFLKSARKKHLHSLSSIFTQLKDEIDIAGAQFIKEMDGGYDLLFRETDFITGSKYQVYPVHGIFTDLVKKFAKKKGISEAEWIRDEYIVKLARMAARMNYKLGFYGGWHTQNLIVEINEQTGSIKRFYIRDWQDLIFDHEIHIHQFKNSYLNNHELPHYLYELNALGFSRSSGAVIIALYMVLESAHWTVTDTDLATLLEDQFLWTYAREVSKIFNLKLDEISLKFIQHDFSSSLGREKGEAFLIELDRQVRLKIRAPINDIGKISDLIFYFDQHRKSFPLRDQVSLRQLIIERFFLKRIYSFDGNSILEYSWRPFGRHRAVRIYPTRFQKERDDIAEKIVARNESKNQSPWNLICSQSLASIR